MHRHADTRWWFAVYRGHCYTLFNYAPPHKAGHNTLMAVVCLCLSVPCLIVNWEQKAVWSWKLAVDWGKWSRPALKFSRKSEYDLFASCWLKNDLNGSVKEPNKFHNYETEKITHKASDVAEYIELFGYSTWDRRSVKNTLVLVKMSDLMTVLAL